MVVCLRCPSRPAVRPSRWRFHETAVGLALLWLIGTVAAAGTAVAGQAATVARPSASPPALPSNGPVSYDIFQKQSLLELTKTPSESEFAGTKDCEPGNYAWSPANPATTCNDPIRRQP